jgi:hypothetical protein
MAEFYIASRNDAGTIAKVAGGRVGKLNNRMADTLRSVAMKQGIKKTQLGKKLEFYSVNKEQLDRMLDPATPFMLKLADGVDFRPLLTVDGEKMTLGLQTVNTQYGNRMDSATHRKYLADLFKAVELSVFKVNEDVKPEKRKNTNPGYKVGDFIGHGEGHNSRESFPAVITKITEAGYQYQVYRPMFGVDEKDPKTWAAEYISLKGATGWGDFWTGEVKVPFLVNKPMFRLDPKVHTRRWTKWCTKVLAVPEDKEEYTYFWDHCN